MLIFFVKSQLPLFDTPVPVAAHVRKDGVFIPRHIRIQKVTVKQPSLFGEQPAIEPPKPTKRKKTKLDIFLSRYGGAAGMARILPTFTEAQQKALIAKMAEAGNVTPEAVVEMLAEGKKEEPKQVDLFAQPVEEPKAAPSLAMPDFQEGKTTTGVKEYYEKVAQQIIDMASAGDAAGLEAIKAKGMKPNAKTGKIPNTWAGKTANSKLILALHAQALAMAGGKPAAVAAPKPAPAAVPEEKQKADKSKEQAAKLREGGEKLLADAQADYGRDRLANTARRARMAAGSEAEAAKRMRTAKTMINIAGAIEDGVARYLTGISTRAAVETLEAAMDNAIYQADRNLPYGEREKRKGRGLEPGDIQHAVIPRAKWGTAGSSKEKVIDALKGKRNVKALVDEMRRSDFVSPDMVAQLKKILGDKQLNYLVGWWNIESAAKQARLERIGIKTDNDLRLALMELATYRDGHQAVDPVKAAERALVGQKVGIDFFPTPKPLAERMAELAGIKPGMKVLEPSAGNGHLADAAREAGGDVHAVEISDTLRNVLSAKKHNIVAHDFESYEPGEKYDAVIMNPPFSDRKDAAHIMRAWDMLKPGGKLVAIAGEGVFFGGDKKATAFREWLDEHGAEVEHLPENTFKGNDLPAQTGANARLVVMEKASAKEKSGFITERSPKELAVEGYRSAEELRHVGTGWYEKGYSDAEIEAIIATKHRLAPGMEFLATRNDHGEVSIWYRPKKNSQDDSGPHEGERNAEGLVFHDGRWHREDAPEPEPAPANPEIEAAEDREDLATELARNPHSEKAKRMIVEAGKRAVEAEEPAMLDEDDPNSPNYRYADTGYIAGSRKEQAASQVIKRAKSEGAQVLITGIDWDELEANPREAKELITKSNLFGVVPWDKLREQGMEPGTGYVIDRIYAAIGTEPAEDKPQARKDYTLGLQTLRERLENCKTPQNVADVLDNLRDEFDGKVLNAEESEEYQKYSAVSAASWEADKKLKDERDVLYRQMTAARNKAWPIEKEIEGRKRRSWKPKPELDEQLKPLKAEAEKAEKVYVDWLQANREKSESIDKIRRAAWKEQQAIEMRAVLRNKIENPLHRAWVIMGERFVNVLRYRSYKGSDAFAKHMTAAKNNQIKDWSWLEKEVAKTPKVSKESARFQMKVADTYKRVGGRDVKPESTAALKEMFGLRDVQSGNWVLKDPVSAKFHVEHCAEAFADLADLLGVPDSQVSFNGRLAMAFGARGHGAKGFKDGAARAHYEPVHRVINLTKMGGGGCLAHEWFHAVDNMIKEAEGGGASGVGDFASVNPDLVPSPKLREAFKSLQSAMLDGNQKKTEKVSYTARDVALARLNLDRMAKPKPAQVILSAGSASAAIEAIDNLFGVNSGERLSPKDKLRVKDWTRIAIAHYGGNPEGGELEVRAGPAMSSFALEAAKLDAGANPYYSTIEEMAARAFQAWVEDRLGQMGRRNDYLSAYADNKYHVDPLFGIEWKPFPEGEERERINRAFDRLFAAMGASNTLAKALAIWDEVDGL